MRSPSYSNSCIYKLCCKDTSITDIYIGSTTNFRNRKHQHKSRCTNINSIEYTQSKYMFIRDTGGWDNWDMILIEYVNCNTILELHKKEREFIELLKPIMNSNNPYNPLTKMEYHKQYSKDKGKIKCECGSEYDKIKKGRHIKTKKHQNYLKLTP